MAIESPVSPVTRRPAPPFRRPRSRWKLPSLACFIVLAAAGYACGRDDSSSAAGAQSAAGASAAARGPGGPGGAGRAALPPISVAVAPAELGSISSYYRATASLEVDNEAELTARVSGTVLAVLAEEGDEVRAGQILLRIDAREYDLRVKQAEAQAAKERSRFERARKMFEQDLISDEDFTTASNDLAAAEASLELAKLELSYTQVAAPFAGRVVRRNTDIGRTVGPGDPLYGLADVHPLLARVHVPAKEFRSLRTDQTVALVLDSDGTELEGRISLISPTIDPNTGTIKVTVEIDDYPAATRPGDFAEVQIITERRDGALLVPKIAVVSEKGERFVYTSQDSVAQRRIVEVGFEDEEHAQILTGLEAGEMVVVQGQRSLEDGAPIRILDPLRFDDESAPRSSS